MHNLTLYSMFVAIGAITPGLALVAQCSDQQTPILHDKIHPESSGDPFHITKKGYGMYCTYNDECETGCCDWGQMVSGYANGKCSDRSSCNWLTNRNHATGNDVTATLVREPHLLELLEKLCEPYGEKYAKFLYES